MTEEPASLDVETLRELHSKDQRSAIEKERDLAIAKCGMHTANHWLFLTKRELPTHLVETLTVQFQEAYLNALLFGDVTVNLYAGEDDE